VAEAEGLAERELEHLLGARREGDLPGGDLFAGADDPDDLRAHALDGDVERLEDAGREALLLTQQTEQDVLRADVVVLERPRFFLRENDHLPGSLCESLEHLRLVLPGCGARGFGGSWGRGLDWTGRIPTGVPAPARVPGRMRRLTPLLVTICGRSRGRVRGRQRRRARVGRGARAGLVRRGAPRGARPDGPLVDGTGATPGSTASSTGASCPPRAARAGRLERVPVEDTADGRAARDRAAARGSRDRRRRRPDLDQRENFAAGKAAGLWLEDWAGELPSARFVDQRDPAVARDFQVPVEGQESPWSRAAFSFAHDTAKLPRPPRDFDALLEYARANPGRFTYPAPPDFTGSAFVRQVVAAKGEDEAFRYLRELKPLMYRRGRTLPKSVAELDQLFADGEVDFTMSYETNFVAAQVRRGTFPRSTRPFVIGKGALVNVSFLTIPKDSSSQAGAKVVAELLLSPELQAKKADPAILGIATVLDMARLPPAERARFTESQDNPYLLRDLGETVEEFPADRVEPLEQRWTREVLRG
jgi:putative spermidine/putrescine transport system substrate-binding protein